ncbi:MAG: polysaccharide deacetylase family protein [Clostridia bacterium]|nr:polysaccharide deacetylase family protein [Clostridia bacterium]MBQ6838877.1 polysaccharide deacetylase family protein [Clostridia bacterium]
MAKYLIVNADDYGMCNAANEAVEELFLGGWLKSSTIMMPCPGAEHAVEFSKAHPEYAIGIHTTLTSEWGKYRWKPLTNGKTLLDEEGFMWHESDMVEKNASYEDIEKEVRAQIDLAHRMGMKPSHVDNHMGSLYGHYTGRLGLSKLALKICGSYGYAYRLYTKHDKRICPNGTPYPLYAAVTLLSKHWGKKYNVIIPDYLLFPDWNDDMRVSYEVYRDTILKIWTDIPEDGVTETFVHPSVESDELKGITGRWLDRVWEYQLMKDPYVHQYLKDHDVELISYRELIKMKGGTVKG